MKRMKKTALLALAGLSLYGCNTPTTPNISTNTTESPTSVKSVEQKVLQSPLHLAHTDFVSLNPKDTIVDGYLRKGTPIAYGSDYFYPANPTVTQGDAIANVNLPIGKVVTGLDAKIYVEDTGLPNGTVRIVDAILWRKGYAQCFQPTNSDEPQDFSEYCPMAWISSISGREANGWSTLHRTPPTIAPIEAGFTYSVIANLRGDSKNQAMRVGWVEVSYAEPSPVSATSPLLAKTPSLSTSDLKTITRGYTALHRKN